MRRLAAILATDVAGYSRLMGKDEAGTLTRLKSLRADCIDPTIAEHQGHVVKEMGDGLLIEFVSVVDAVRCAVDLQQSLADREVNKAEDHRMQFRMGVNLGDIIAENDDIYGDGVNVAARLETLAQPGGICIAGKVYDEVKNRLELIYSDLGQQHLKNIAEPVRVYRVHSRSTQQEEKSISAILDRPSVAVLPFVNMSGDAEQEYFADGLTEDVITALSHWRLFPVISRTSAFTYKDKPVTVQQVAEELGVSYVLEGSVRKVGDRVRIGAQLIDAKTGYHIWAHNYDRDITDILALQDQITGLIASTMQPELAKAEEQRSLAKAAPKDLRAWDYVQRGWFAFWKYALEANKRAQELFEKAIEIDPEYSQAYTGLSLAHHFDIIWGVPGARESAPQKMLETAKRAVALDDEDAAAHLALAFAYHRTNQYDQAIYEGRKAVELNPSDPLAHLELGSALDFFGESEAGIASFKTALTLLPPHGLQRVYRCRVALAYLHVRDFESAVEWAKDAISAGPAYSLGYVTLAASLAHLGRLDVAKQALARGEAIEPGLVEKWHEWPLYHLDEQKQLVIDGVRLAGWKGDPSQLPTSRKPHEGS